MENFNSPREIRKGEVYVGNHFSSKRNNCDDDPMLQTADQSNNHPAHQAN